MKKTRLNKFSRTRLHKLAQELYKILPENEADVRALAIARTIADKLVRKRLIALYPQKDMEVLRRYDKARQDYCIRVNLVAGGITQWQLDGEQPAPWRPETYCTPIQVDEETTKAIEAFRKLEGEQKAAREFRIKPYQSLINYSRHFEDVVEVWPEAERIRSECGAQSTALVVGLTDELVEAIRADVRARAAVSTEHVDIQE